MNKGARGGRVRGRGKRRIRAERSGKREAGSEGRITGKKTTQAKRERPGPKKGK